MTKPLEFGALALVAVVFLVVKWQTAGSRAPGDTGPTSLTAFATRRPRAGRLALQDWLVSGYLLFFWLLAFLGEGSRRDVALRWVSIDALVFMVLLFVARWPESPRRIADVAYRLALPGAIVSTFSQLHYLLPTARTSTFDAEICALDHRIFGFEPAESWDAYVSPATTEWFSFFYYLYFAIVLIHVLPMAALEKRIPVLREFSWGIFWVFCVGQLVYVAVPAYGPYRYLGPTFQHSLEGARFWPLVSSTVASFDGAHRTDVFPSLHTAVPTFLTLFSFRHRDKLPLKYSWPVLAFVTSNIIVATMFLRWHYLLDICAGLTLATSAFLGARWIPAWEDAWRARSGQAPIWRPLVGADLEPLPLPPLVGIVHARPRERTSHRKAPPRPRS